MLSDVLREHLLRPRHAGRPARAHCSARAANPVCGDVLHLHAARDERGGLELCFEAEQACSAVLALSSFALERCQGLRADELRSVDARALAAEAGGLPPGKSHAADLLQRALESLLAELDA
ncbi:MAG: iron-sulfur cluster assembly scaffold protein [Planctomycetes bacterium]|nr:iron-sulfur cluster assembly scaffold protein [Planctomycetota bacterium]